MARERMKRGARGQSAKRADAPEVPPSQPPAVVAGQARSARIRVPSTDAPGKAVRATLATPHVGRAAELALFRDWLAAASSGDGGVHLVAGPSGIGKTRLVTAVAADAQRHGWQVGVGRAYAVETG